MSIAEDHLQRGHPDLDVEELMEILDALPSLVVVVDADERNLYANLAAQAWLGHAPDPLLGKPLRGVLDEDAYAAVASHVRAALAGVRQTFERAMQRPDGTVVYTLTDYVPRIRAGRPDGFIGLVTDVTRQVTAELAHAAGQERVEELLELNSAAAGVSDDVLQELFTISLHLERMQRFPDRDLGHAGPLVEVLSRSIDRLRESIKLLVAEGKRPGDVRTNGPDPAAIARPSVEPGE
jgi:PAS domain S-box-containing protein